MTPVETIRSLKLISSEAGQPVATAIHDIIHTLCLPILFSSGQETLINVYLQSSGCSYVIPTFENATGAVFKLGGGKNTLDSQPTLWLKDFNII